MGAETALRTALALCALAVIWTPCAVAAPVTESTELDTYNGTGCYYNFNHYGEGDRIHTNEPCLNCTCHNRMLMCYLRVCPYTKQIGQDCNVVNRVGDCCPVIECPDVQVDVSHLTTSSPDSKDVGHLDSYGCTIDDKFYAEGAKVPGNLEKPCELCYCIRNMTACVMQECTLHVDGCTPVYHKGVCCPVRYSCDHPDDEEIHEMDEITTTVRPTPGFILTTTTAPGYSMECIHNGVTYADGALIETDVACEHCYCMKGDMVCAVQECGTPMENEGKSCTATSPKAGQCCPDTYVCDDDEITTLAVDRDVTSKPDKEEDTVAPQEVATDEPKPQPEAGSQEREPTTLSPIGTTKSESEEGATPKVKDHVEDHTELETEKSTELPRDESSTPAHVDEHKTTQPKVHDIPEEISSSEKPDFEHDPDEDSSTEVSRTTGHEKESEVTIKPVDHTETPTLHERFPEDDLSTEVGITKSEKDEYTTAKPHDEIEGSGAVSTDIDHEFSQTTVHPPTRRADDGDHLATVKDLQATKAPVKPEDATKRPESEQAPTEISEAEQEPTEQPEGGDHITNVLPGEDRDGTTLPDREQDQATKIPDKEHDLTEKPEKEGDATELPLKEHDLTERPVEEHGITELPETESDLTEKPEKEDSFTEKPEDEHDTTKEAEKEQFTTKKPEEYHDITEQPEKEHDITKIPEKAEIDHEVTERPDHDLTKQPSIEDITSHPDITDIPEVEQGATEPSKYDATKYPEDFTKLPEIDEKVTEYLEKEHDASDRPGADQEHTEKEEDHTASIVPSKDREVTEQPEKDLGLTEEPEKMPVTEVSEKDVTKHPEDKTTKQPSVRVTTEYPEKDHDVTKITEKEEVTEPSKYDMTKYPEDVSQLPEKDESITKQPEKIHDVTEQIDEDHVTMRPEYEPSVTEHSAEHDDRKEPSTDLPGSQTQELATEGPVTESEIPEQSDSTEKEADELTTPLIKAQTTEEPIEHNVIETETETTAIPERDQQKPVKEEKVITVTPTHDYSTSVPKEEDEHTTSAELYTTVVSDHGEEHTTTKTVPEKDRKDTTQEEDHRRTTLSSTPETTENIPLDSERFGDSAEDKDETSSPVEVTTVHDIESSRATDSVTDKYDQEKISTPKASKEPESATPKEVIEKTTMSSEHVTTPIIREDEESTTPVFDQQQIDQLPEEPSRIPGEGDCLVDGVAYRNYASVPPVNKCQSSCSCINSVLKCERAECPPPPANMKNCQPVQHNKDACCPTYTCEHVESPVTIESESHVVDDHETPAPSDATTKIPEKEINEERTIEPDTRAQTDAPEEQKPEDQDLYTIPDTHITEKPEPISEPPVIYLPDCGTEGCFKDSTKPGQEIPTTTDEIDQFSRFTTISDIGETSKDEEITIRPVVPDDHSTVAPVPPQVGGEITKVPATERTPTVRSDVTVPLELATEKIPHDDEKEITKETEFDSATEHIEDDSTKPIDSDRFGEEVDSTTNVIEDEITTSPTDRTQVDIVSSTIKARPGVEITTERKEAEAVETSTQSAEVESHTEPEKQPAAPEHGEHTTVSDLESATASKSGSTQIPDHTETHVTDEPEIEIPIPTTAKPDDRISEEKYTAIPEDHTTKSEIPEDQTTRLHDIEQEITPKGEKDEITTYVPEIERTTVPLDDINKVGVSVLPSDTVDDCDSDECVTKKPIEKPADCGPQGCDESTAAPKTPATDKPADCGPQGCDESTAVPKTPATDKPADCGPQGCDKSTTVPKTPATDKPADCGPQGCDESTIAPKTPATDKPADCGPQGCDESTTVPKTPATVKPADCGPQGCDESTTAPKTPATEKPMPTPDCEGKDCISDDLENTIGDECESGDCKPAQVPHVEQTTHSHEPEITTLEEETETPFKPTEYPKPDHTIKLEESENEIQDCGPHGCDIKEPSETDKPIVHEPVTEKPVKPEPTLVCNTPECKEAPVVECNEEKCVPVVKKPIESQPKPEASSTEKSDRVSDDQEKTTLPPREIESDTPRTDVPEVICIGDSCAFEPEKHPDDSLTTIQEDVVTYAPEEQTKFPVSSEDTEKPEFRPVTEGEIAVATVTAVPSQPPKEEYETKIPVEGDQTTLRPSIDYTTVKSDIVPESRPEYVTSHTVEVPTTIRSEIGATDESIGPIDDRFSEDTESTKHPVVDLESTEQPEYDQKTELPDMPKDKTTLAPLDEEDKIELTEREPVEHLTTKSDQEKVTKVPEIDSTELPEGIVTEAPKEGITEVIKEDSSEATKIDITTEHVEHTTLAEKPYITDKEEDKEGKTTLKPTTIQHVAEPDEKTERPSVDKTEKPEDELEKQTEKAITDDERTTDQSATEHEEHVTEIFEEERKSTKPAPESDGQIKEKPKLEPTEKPYDEIPVTDKEVDHTESITEQEPVTDADKDHVKLAIDTVRPSESGTQQPDEVTELGVRTQTDKPESQTEVTKVDKDETEPIQHERTTVQPKLTEPGFETKPTEYPESEVTEKQTLAPEISKDDEFKITEQPSSEPSLTTTKPKIAEGEIEPELSTEKMQHEAEPTVTERFGDSDVDKDRKTEAPLHETPEKPDEESETELPIGVTKVDVTEPPKSDVHEVDTKTPEVEEYTEKVTPESERKTDQPTTQQDELVTEVYQDDKKPTKPAPEPEGQIKEKPELELTEKPYDEQPATGKPDEHVDQVTEQEPITSTEVATPAHVRPETEVPEDATEVIVKAQTSTPESATESETDMEEGTEKQDQATEGIPKETKVSTKPEHDMGITKPAESETVKPYDYETITSRPTEKIDDLTTKAEHVTDLQPEQHITEEPKVTSYDEPTVRPTEEIEKATTIKSIEIEKETVYPAAEHTTHVDEPVTEVHDDRKTESPLIVDDEKTTAVPVSPEKDERITTSQPEQEEPSVVTKAEEPESPEKDERITTSRPEHEEPSVVTEAEEPESPEKDERITTSRPEHEELSVVTEAEEPESTKLPVHSTAAVTELPQEEPVTEAEKVTVVPDRSGLPSSEEEDDASKSSTESSEQPTKRPTEKPEHEEEEEEEEEDKIPGQDQQQEQVGFGDLPSTLGEAPTTTLSPFTLSSKNATTAKPTTYTTTRTPVTEHQETETPADFPGSSYGSTAPDGDETGDYEEDDHQLGPGTCRYGGKVYVSAQQIPRDDPCDFCFCFRSDIICLQQSCPPPIQRCHEEPIQGFCCPRYECPVSMATVVNMTTTTTTTTTTLPPHFLSHAYKGAARKQGCQLQGKAYRVGEVVQAASGPCLHCTCGGDGQMKCDPKACTPEPMLQKMIAAVATSRRR